MAKARPQPRGNTDAEEHERLNTMARGLTARAGEHFDGVLLIGTYRDSKGHQRVSVWTDGDEYRAYGMAKDFVVASEERMRLGTFAPDVEGRETA